MKLTQRIAQHLTEVYEGGNWTEVNIKDTLADVGYKEALAVTNASDNTIASLIHHLGFYNGVVIQRLSGTDPVINESNGFGIPAIKDETAWQKVKDDNMKSARQLASLVRELPEEKLFELTAAGLSTYYKTLHGLIEHAHYHLGQVVLLKKLIRQQGLLS